MLRPYLLRTPAQQARPPDSLIAFAGDVPCTPKWDIDVTSGMGQ